MLIPRYMFAVAITIIGMVAAGPVSAQNLVQNPSFETALAPNWSSPSDPNNTAVVQGPNRVSGLRSLQFSSNSLDSVSQNITTTANQSYTFSFYIKPVGPGSQFQAFFNGEKLFDMANLPTTADFTQYSFTRAATLGTTQIRFAGFGSGQGVYLDDVSVVAAAVPEPTSWMLIILGFGIVGIGLGGRQRRPRFATTRIHRS